MTPTTIRPPDARPSATKFGTRAEFVSRAEFDALARRIAALEAALASPDERLAIALLPALAIAVGDESFESDYVSETRDPNIRFIVGRRSSKSVGKFLERIEGRPFAGFVVVSDLDADGRVRKLRNRRQWRLRRVVS